MNKSKPVVHLSSFCAVKPSEVAISFRASALGMGNYDLLLSTLQNAPGVQIEKRNSGSDVTITVGTTQLNQLADKWSSMGMEVIGPAIRDHDGANHPSVPKLLQYYAR